MITTKQRAYLRSLTNNLDAIFQIGKGGLNDNMIRQIDEALEAREVVKVTVLRSAPMEAYEACDAMADATHADIVSTVGGKFVLYRESKTKKQIYLQD
ncbi:MAG: ribosome assembly RNA-binding protein YhbY [Eubacteriales bacterium]|nr:ribosome assembly RNA-binding protein YhbY [Eubacteriales bacterium]